VEFAKKYTVVGFDINSHRIRELKAGRDSSLELEEEDLKKVLCGKPGTKGLYCTDQPDQISGCQYFIVTVPTPTDKHNHPDLTPLYKASDLQHRFLLRLFSGKNQSGR
jgi:UDP-N-acetyl-D-galactosamine dehydrogenase